MDIEERLEKVNQRLRDGRRLSQEDLLEIGEELRALEELMRELVH